MQLAIQLQHHAISCKIMQLAIQLQHHAIQHYGNQAAMPASTA